ncbi:MAG TPA: DedA family protein [Candidatus Paceibacterota bacterium]|nr:DedA family protein [Candidatus Paceibacterota bacterium]HPT18026.1 DedA family protein [Candidatus Paceibacterota bacterium]
MINFLNPEVLISTLGYTGIFSTIFLESGFFFGFFLPGDTLLFSVGFFASGGMLSYSTSLIGLYISTYLGAVAGYLFGKKTGEKIFSKKGSFLFDPKNIDRTKIFYDKYGKWTIVLSRFVPVVRTFAPILAGVGKMKLKTFLKFNALGSILWPTVVVSVGYFFGSQLPSIHKYVMPVICFLFLITLVPIFIAMAKEFWRRKNV